VLIYVFSGSAVERNDLVVATLPNGMSTRFVDVKDEKDAVEALACNSTFVEKMSCTVEATAVYVWWGGFAW
jgi:hypothetical protein